MGELINGFAKFRNTLRVFRMIRKISMDAIREALEDAERDLDTLNVVKALSPDYRYADGSTVNDRIEAKMARIQDLKADLMGNC